MFEAYSGRKISFLIADEIDVKSFHGSSTQIFFRYNFISCQKAKSELILQKDLLV